jgi:hypothetical protein
MSGKLFKLGGGEPLIKKIRWRIFEKGSNILTRKMYLPGQELIDRSFAYLGNCSNSEAESP